MAGIPVIAADTDEEAEFLATTPQQMFLKLIRNHPGPLVPPVKGLDWNPFEEEAVEAKFRAAIVGSPETVGRKLALFLDQTKVDELMIATNPYEHAARLRSYEIVAELAGISARENSLQTATR
jgi:alkanesulfonate monooxygenase SsuD/methylene tetrahydromethanopterin reductase-like flavin-dependent oxidoreductase (luciferase family)